MDSEGGGATEQGHAHSPWLLELDSDSEEDRTKTTQSGTQPGPANGAVLAPPPLKVGRGKVADPAANDGAAGEGGGDRGRGRREGGVAWRPMPRLVPLGLRGTPPS